ncbi:hypothetical protein ABW19_dt0201985 [Dactylella cylindrospora]|nr:hypothetical protein ABW19_dt0201985 [Dactylella cylindrospora]
MTYHLTACQTDRDVPIDDILPFHYYVLVLEDNMKLGNIKGRVTNRQGKQDIGLLAARANLREFASIAVNRQLGLRTTPVGVSFRVKPYPSQFTTYLWKPGNRKEYTESPVHASLSKSERTALSQTLWKTPRHSTWTEENMRILADLIDRQIVYPIFPGQPNGCRTRRSNRVLNSSIPSEPQDLGHSSTAQPIPMLPPTPCSRPPTPMDASREDDVSECDYESSCEANQEACDAEGDDVDIEDDTRSLGSVKYPTGRVERGVSEEIPFAEEDITAQPGSDQATTMIIPPTPTPSVEEEVAIPPAAVSTCKTPSPPRNPVCIVKLLIPRLYSIVNAQGQLISSQSPSPIFVTPEPVSGFKAPVAPSPNINFSGISSSRTSLSPESDGGEDNLSDVDEQAELGVGGEFWIKFQLGIKKRIALKKELKAKNSKVKGLERMMKDAKQQINYIGESYGRNAERLADAERENCNLSQQVAYLRRSEDELRVQLLAAEEAKELARRESEQAYQDLLAEKESLKAALESMEVQANTQMKAYKVLQENEGSIRADYRALDTQFQTLHADNAALKLSYQLLQVEAGTVRTDHEALNVKYESLKATNEKLQQRVNARNDMLSVEEGLDILLRQVRVIRNS